MVLELRTDCGKPLKAATGAPVIAQECVCTLKDLHCEVQGNQGGTTT